MAVKAKDTLYLHTAFRNVDSQGRLHTHFGYASTGRLRSFSEGGEGTNLQNLTKDSKFVDEDE